MSNSPAAVLKEPPVLLSIRVTNGGTAQVDCNIPKLEAVKLLLNVVEELRFQGYREHDRMIEVPRARLPTE
jgi:hypothetical protein